MGSYKEHQALVRRLLVYCHQNFKKIRLWQIATGAGVPYAIVKQAIKEKDLSKLTPIHFGLKGHPDVTGVHCGIWVGIEVKTGNARQSEDQKNFQKMIKDMGGVYLVVRADLSLEEQLTPLKKIEEWAHENGIL